MHGKVVEILQKLNSINCKKIAIDIPTGLNSDTGACHPDTFRADITVTMFAPKLGLFLNSGPDVCGEVIDVTIGAPERIVKKISSIRVVENSDINNFFPVRQRNSSKFDYGRIAIVAGSRNMAGAAALSANAAIKSGAGLVELITPERHSSLLPEIICHVNDANANGYLGLEDYPNFRARLEKADVIALGPGLGDAEPTIKLIEKIVEDFKLKKKIIIDADGLKFIKKDFKGNGNICLTPHYGEFATITGTDRKLVVENPYEAAVRLANDTGCTVLLKGNPTIVCNTQETFINPTGNPGMATAGSGDVLTGIISAFAAQIDGFITAVAAAAYVHGKAGDLYNENHSQKSLTSSDLIDYIKFVV